MLLTSIIFPKVNKSVFLCIVYLDIRQVYLDSSFVRRTRAKACEEELWLGISYFWARTFKPDSVLSRITSNVFIVL